MENIMIGMGLGIMVMTACIAIFDLRRAGMSDEEILKKYFQQD